MPEFFHVNRTVQNPHEALREDDVVETSDTEFNPYYQGQLNAAKTIDFPDAKYSLLSFFNEISKGTFLQHPALTQPVVGHFAQKSLEPYVNLVRELHFENVRREQFPSLPSRLHCVWLAKDLDDGRQWHEKLGYANDSQLLRVEVEQEVFTTNDWFLNNEAETYYATMENARNYWSSASGNGHAEHLYMGKMKVLEVVSTTHAGG